MNYGEEYGEHYKTIGVPELRRLLSRIRKKLRFLEDSDKRLVAKGIAIPGPSAAASAYKDCADMLAAILEKTL